MVLPGLLLNVNKAAYVAKLKKAYEVISQTTSNVLLESGNISFKAGFPNVFTTADISEIANIYVDKMDAAKICDTYTDCFAATYKQWPDGTNGPYSTDYIFPTDTTPASCAAPGNCIITKTFITKDGISYGFGRASNTSQFKTGGGQAHIAILVDINGPKAPNVLGRDLFAFWTGVRTSIKPNSSDYSFNKFVPGHSSNPTCLDNSPSNSNGLYCTWEALNGINY